MQNFKNNKIEELYGLTVETYALNFTKKTDNEMRMRDIGLKIAQALEFIHEFGIVVRDLDSGKILMTDNSNIGFPRIANLNKAILLGPHEKTEDLYGDIRFKAPEVVQGKKYDSKADCWSFGVIMFLMLAKHHPFREGVTDD